MRLRGACSAVRARSAARAVARVARAHCALATHVVHGGPAVKVRVRVRANSRCARRQREPSPRAAPAVMGCARPRSGGRPPTDPITRAAAEPRVGASAAARRSRREAGAAAQTTAAAAPHSRPKRWQPRRRRRVRARRGMRPSPDGAATWVGKAVGVGARPTVAVTMAVWGWNSTAGPSMAPRRRHPPFVERQC